LTSFFEDAWPAARRFSDEFHRRRNAMPSQRLFGLAPLSSGGEGHRQRRSCQGDGADEEDASLRCLHPRGNIREHQRVVHDLYLVQVKSQEESKGTWDFVKLIATIPPDQAFRPLNRSKCSLVKTQ